jgi:DNA-binding CsgD family transcriptional regulator
MTQCGKELGISTSTLHQWRTNPPKLTKVEQNLGEVINGFKILRQIGFNKVEVECTGCGTVMPKWWDQIDKHKARCRVCNPSQKSVYLTDIKDLLQLGMTTAEIADELGCGIGVVAVVKRELGLTEESEEYSFPQIAEYLGLSEHETRKAYKSGMKKLEKWLKEKVDFKDLAAH